MTTLFNPGSGAARERAFTIVELLTSILVIGVLIGLLIVGLGHLTGTAKKTKQRAAVTSMKQAVADFKSKFGFLPPLVRDAHPTMARRQSVEEYTLGSATLRRIAVSDSSTPAGLNHLELNSPMPGPTANNPYSDPRFSVRSLPFYLGAGLEVDLEASGSHTLPIDGVVGPRMFRPREDGSFDIPREVFDSIVIRDEDPRKLSSDVYQGFVDVGSADPRLIEGTDTNLQIDVDNDLATNPLKARLQFKDSKGVAYRYYRWLRKPATTPGVINENIPLVVGNAADASVHAANYAIVGAGPNGVFGDEQLPYLLDKLGRSATYSESAARQEAAGDNVVEVGQ